MRIRAQVIFQDTSGFAEDRYINTFYFDNGDGPGEFAANQLSAIGEALNEYYQTPVAGTGQALRGFLAPHIVASPIPRVKYYDEEAGGSPIGESDLLGWTSTAGSRALPSEIALCMSFHGDLTGLPNEIPLPPDGPEGDLRPKSRHMGRVYIGPFNVNALPSDTGSLNQRSRPRDDLRNTMREGGARLMNSPTLAGVAVDWIVWSDSNANGYPVVGGWVDDAWDVLRKRGAPVSARGTW